MDDVIGLSRLFVDERFLETYGVEIVAGRGFSEAFATDPTEGFIVNEHLVKRAGWESPEAAIGKSVEMGFADIERRGRIVGVAKDFHLFSLRGPVTSVGINIMPAEYLNFVSVRLAPGRPAGALESLEQRWAEFSPGYPFEYYFLDEDFERLHQSDRRLGQVFTTFAGLAIFIACLGLFALAAFTAEQRTKEIGVRKDFTRLVLIAFAIAIPLAYYVMDRWLAAFAFRVDLSIWMFAAAGVAALLIAWLTVSYQTFKAALTDPVTSLRYE
jgi:putative ABC transport system permease protein